MPKPPISFNLDAKARASSFAQAIRPGRPLPSLVERRPRLRPGAARKRSPSGVGPNRPRSSSRAGDGDSLGTTRGETAAALTREMRVDS